MDALDLNIEQGVGIEADVHGPAHIFRERNLVGALDLEKPLLETCIRSMGVEVGQGFGFVQEPLADRLFQKSGQTGIALVQPAARRDAVGLVVDTIRILTMQVGENRLLHQFGVQGRHAIDAVRTDKGQIGHAHPALSALVNQGNGRDGGLVHLLVLAHARQNPRIDGVDQLHVARQQTLEQGQGPAFQRLWQEGVVGVAKGPDGDVPGLVKAQAVQVDQQSHELGHRHGRVGVVQLDRHLVWQGADVAVELDVAPDNVLQRGGGEEILLPQAKLLTRRGRIRRIEDAGQGLGAGGLGQGADMVARVEGVELNRVQCPRLPKAQRVDPFAAPADHGRVDRQRDHLFGGNPTRDAGLVRLDLASKADRIGALAAFKFPGVAVGQPGFGQFDLPALIDPLAEHAVDIADAIAIGRKVERGQALHETGGQPPQPAIAERGVGFKLAQHLKVDAERGQRLAHLFHHPKIGQAVAQQPPDQEFQAEIIDALGPRRVGRAG